MAGCLGGCGVFDFPVISVCGCCGIGSPCLGLRCFGGWVCLSGL